MVKKEFPYLTFLRILAMCSVIRIHTVCTPVTLFANTYSVLELRLSVLVTNLLRMFAVPVFVMISGALFLNPEKIIPLNQLLSKYVFRLIIALCIFSFLFCFMELYYTYRSISLSLFYKVLVNVLEGKSWDHMWYLYMLPGLYFFIPFLKRFLENASKTELYFTLCILFIFTSLIPTFTTLTGLQIGLNIPVTSIWFLYFLLGYTIHCDIIQISVLQAIILITIPIIYLSAGVFIPGFIIIEGAGLKFTSTNEVFAIFLSTGIFALVKNKYKRTDNFKITRKISILSFGIYIIHAIFINIFYKVLQLNPININIFLLWITVFSVSLLGSLIITYVLRKINFIRRYVL